MAKPKSIKLIPNPISDVKKFANKLKIRGYILCIFTFLSDLSHTNKFVAPFRQKKDSNLSCCLLFLIYLRKERDSNPRYSYPYTAFRVRPIRPLWHLSKSTAKIDKKLRKEQKEKETPPKNHEEISDYHLSLLAEIVHEMDAKIVLSSTWRQLKDDDTKEIKEMWDYLVDSLAL